MSEPAGCGGPEWPEHAAPQNPGGPGPYLCSKAQLWLGQAVLGLGRVAALLHAIKRTRALQGASHSLLLA